MVGETYGRRTTTIPSTRKSGPRVIIMLHTVVTDKCDMSRKAVALKIGVSAASINRIVVTLKVWSEMGTTGLHRKSEADNCQSCMAAHCLVMKEREISFAEMHCHR